MNIFESQESRIEQQAQKALTALEEYKHQRFDRHIKHESLEEKLYALFENIWYPDKTYQYGDNIVTILSLLLKPDVMAVLKKEVSPIVQDDITRMLLNLYDFFKGMAGDYYLLQLEMVEIEHCRDIEKLKGIEKKYKAKLEGCLARQQFLKGKSIHCHSLKVVDNE